MATGIVKRVLGLRKRPAGKLRKRHYRAPANKTSKAINNIGHGNVERSASALPVIRRLARDLARNSPYASAAVRTLVNHAVGRGIGYSLTGDEEYRKDFFDWMNSTDCDYDGQQTLHGLITTAAKTMFAAGDVLLVVRHQKRAGRVELKLQVIDPDQIAESATPMHAGNDVIAGVEVDTARGGRVVGYHIHPDPDSLDTEYIPADKAILLFEREYPGQVRGVPRGSQALDMSSNAVDFMSHAIAKAKVEACLSIFLKTPSGEDGEYGLFGELDDEGGGDDGDEFAIPEQLAPASIIPLPEGWEAQVVAPTGIRRPEGPPSEGDRGGRRGLRRDIRASQR